MKNQETRSTVNKEMIFLEEVKPVVEKLPADRWDKIFAGIYLLLGIIMWNCLVMENFTRGLSMFSVLYVVTVLVYLRLKKIPMTGEKIFWTLILLGISLPYSFYSIFDFGQTLMIFVTAAYWTLAVTEGLLWKGRTSSWVLLDGWNGLIALHYPDPVPGRYGIPESGFRCAGSLRRRYVGFFGTMYCRNPSGISYVRHTLWRRL